MYLYAHLFSRYCAGKAVRLFTSDGEDQPVADLRLKPQSFCIELASFPIFSTVFQCDVGADVHLLRCLAINDEFHLPELLVPSFFTRKFSVMLPHIYYNQIQVC
jgi:hypothetical protein